MGLSRLILLLLVLISCSPRYPATDVVSHFKTEEVHSFEHIRQMALRLLRQGAKSSYPEDQFLAVFGAGISGDRETLSLLLDSLHHQNGQIQLAALQLLTGWHDDVVDSAIHQAMGSPYLNTRLEAVRYLCQKKSSTAYGQLDALMAKVDPHFHPLFPQLYATIGDNDCVGTLRRMLMGTDDEVRIQSILSVAEFHRDDLLKEIRLLATHLDVAQQEACAYALGVLRDEKSADRLEKMTNSTTPTVKIAAYRALLQLGRDEVLSELTTLAKEGEENPYAIALLADIPGNEETLASLLTSENLQTRANAALALLVCKDPRCLRVLPELLIKDSRDLALQRATSPGQSLQSWKVIHSAGSAFRNDPLRYEMAIREQEWILQRAAELPEASFIDLANTVLLTEQRECIPLTIALLENRRTAAAVELLKTHQQRLGTPLVRWYCNLALFRIGEEGPYEENLMEWVARKHDTELIQFRPMLPWIKRPAPTPYQLTPTETSRLLVESFEALAQRQDEAGIRALLQAVEQGHPQNRYALAGLLLRAIQ